MEVFEKEILAEYRRKICRVFNVFDVVPRLERLGTLHTTALQKLKTNMKSETQEDKTNKLLNMLENSKKTSAFDDFVLSLTGYSKYATIQEELSQAKRKYLKNNKDDHKRQDLIMLESAERSLEKRKEELLAYVSEKEKENAIHLDIYKEAAERAKRELEDKNAKLNAIRDEHDQVKRKLQEEIQDLRIELKKKNEIIKLKEEEIVANRQIFRKIFEEQEKCMNEHKTYIKLQNEHMEMQKEHMEKQKEHMEKQKEHMVEQKEHMVEQKEHMVEQTVVLKEYRKYIQEIRSTSSRPVQRNFHGKCSYVPRQFPAIPSIKKTTKAKPFRRDSNDL